MFNVEVIYSQREKPYFTTLFQFYVRSGWTAFDYRRIQRFGAIFKNGELFDIRVSICLPLSLITSCSQGNCLPTPWVELKHGMDRVF